MIIDGRIITDPSILEWLADFDRRQRILEKQIDDLRGTTRVKVLPSED